MVDAGQKNSDPLVQERPATSLLAESRLCPSPPCVACPFEPSCRLLVPANGRMLSDHSVPDSRDATAPAESGHHQHVFLAGGKAVDCTAEAGAGDPGAGLLPESNAIRCNADDVLLDDWHGHANVAVSVMALDAGPAL